VLWRTSWCTEYVVTAGYENGFCITSARIIWARLTRAMIVLGHIAASVGISESEVQRILDTLL
jgi:hypothetical protein